MTKRIQWISCGLLAFAIGYAGMPALAEEWTKTREPTEWFISYAFNTQQKNLPRVLLIGDSICNGYSRAVQSKLKGQANVTFLATSKCVCDPSYLRLLAFMLDEYSYDVIQFNNGLHSLYSDRTAWAKELQKAIRLIREKGKGAAIVWASSTPLKDPKLTERSRELNAIASKIMTEEKIPTLDLFALMDPLDRQAFWRDTFHYKNTGIDMQAQAISENVLRILKDRRAK